MAATQVLIIGGGVAALEAAVALRALAGGCASVELVAPEAEFTYRPLSVAEPFTSGKLGGSLCGHSRLRRAPA